MTLSLVDVPVLLQPSTEHQDSVERDENIEGVFVLRENFSLQETQGVYPSDYPSASLEMMKESNVVWKEVL